MADATPVEGEVDHELACGRPVKRSGRASDGDRSEDRDFNAVVRHPGERSAARHDVALKWGRPAPTRSGDAWAQGATSSWVRLSNWNNRAPIHRQRGSQRAVTLW